MSAVMDETREGQELQVRPKRDYPDYSAEFKAEALATLQANGGNYSETAREMGIPGKHMLIWRWAHGIGISPAVAQHVQAKKGELAQKHWVTAHRAQDHMTDEKLEKASARDLQLISAIATDKALLLEGEATSVVQHKSDPHSEWNKTLDIALERARLAGCPMSREEGARLLCEGFPEARKYLLPEG